MFLHKNCFKLKQIIKFIFILIIYTLQFFKFVNAIRCYCTDEHCVPYGVCEATVCLVGLLKTNNAGKSILKIIIIIKILLI